MAVEWIQYVCPECGRTTTQAASARQVECHKITQHDRRQRAIMHKKKKK